MPPLAYKFEGYEVDPPELPDETTPVYNEFNHQEMAVTITTVEEDDGKRNCPTWLITKRNK
ncbi:hypothetical protein C0J52_15015 [Blattella germanica]|nr:hypothetical protein C0J52_15015 [Blattella germanica]